jgi:hypothetical protein
MTDALWMIWDEGDDDGTALTCYRRGVALIRSDIPLTGEELAGLYADATEAYEEHHREEPSCDCDHVILEQRLLATGET